MRTLVNQHRLRLIAALLLSLAASLWLQGDHLHITDKHPVSEHCLVCQFSGAAAPAPELILAIALPGLALLAAAALAAPSPARRLRPPARAPPLFS